MRATIQSHTVSDQLVRDLVEAIRDRQEARGEDHRDATSYALGYLSSVLTSVLAESPKAREFVKSTTKYVKETK